MHAAFKAAGFQLLPVGGCVRDFLLGLEPDDIDLATDAMPEQIIELLSDYKFTSENLQGKAFGVLRVQTKYFPEGIEIATFRKDITSGRKPEVKIGGITMEEDATRRDLTINAMFWDISEKKVIDFVGGVSDLEHRRIVMPGRPLDRLNEDGLRVMRLPRFKNKIGGTYASDVILAIASKNPKLESIDGDGNHIPVSQERVWGEFEKGLKQAINPRDYVMDLIDLNIIGEVFPGFIKTNSVVLDSRKSEIIVAGLMLGRFAEAQTTSGRRALVNYLKFTCHLTDKQAHGVVLLMRILGKNVEEMYEIHRGLGKTSITFADAALFLNDLERAEGESFGESFRHFVEAVALYSPTIKSADLQAEGFFDNALGAEMKRRETELFTKLLNL